MKMLRYIVKILLLPVSLVLLAAKGMIHVAVNLTSAVIGLFILFVGGSLLYCLVTQQWKQLLIFSMIGAAVVAVLFVVVVLENAIDRLREKIQMV